MPENEHTNPELDGLDPGNLFALGLDTARSPVLSTMILRISARGKIHYINTAFATYLGSSVEELSGQPVEVARQLCSPQIAECMDSHTASMAAAGLVTDTTGRVFEPLISLDAGVLDVSLTEVTPGVARHDSFESLTGIVLAEMDETEFRRLRIPETGDVSILAIRIHSLSALARSQTRQELCILLDAVEEVAANTIISFTGTLAGAGTGCFLGIFGAPRHFQDHALRAVAAASELRRRFVHLAATFTEDGKSFPKLGLAVWTGEALAGALGGQRLGTFSVVGAPVQAALELSNLSGEGEILVGEPTLSELVATPPEGWTFYSAQTDSDPDLSYFQWPGSTILPLPKELCRLRIEMVSADTPDGPAHFTFEHLWSLQPTGAEEPSPVVRLLDGEVPAVLPLKEGSEQVQGHALGRYKLLEVLGAGGMGKVWLAKDRFGHPVAIKVLHTHGTPSSEALKRFRREGEIMAKLRHRSICRIYEMNEVDGISFIAMEYVSGISLSELLFSLPESTTQKGGAKASDSELSDLIREAKQRRSSQQEREQNDGFTQSPRLCSKVPLGAEQTLALFSKICEAMQFAHETGVLHRDLKPGNILLREDGEPLIADFGLAKLASGDEHASLSLTGNVVGTLQNMAPEQADSSKHVDERADIYSLGTILYQMLTGHPHFVATGNIIVDSPKLQEHQPIRPRVHNSALDADLETIVLKCLQSDPRRRYRSVRALLTDLEHYRRGEPISARPISVTEVLWKQIRRHKTVSVLSAVFLLIIAVGTIVAFVHITERAEAAQAAAAEAEAQRKVAEIQRKEAEVQRKEAELQRQLSEQNKRRAEEKQALAEQREREAKRYSKAAKESAEIAQLREKEALEREKETQEALAALRNAETKAEKQAQLRLSAEAEVQKEVQLRIVAESLTKTGVELEPTLTLRDKFLGKDRNLQEAREYYRREIVKELSNFGSGLSEMKNHVVAKYDPPFHARSRREIWRVNDWADFSKKLPADLLSKISYLDQLLSYYFLSEPEEGLLLLFYFKLAIFDVDSGTSILKALNQRGVAPAITINSGDSVGEIQSKFRDALKNKPGPEGDMLRIHNQFDKTVRVETPKWFPAQAFCNALSKQMSISADFQTEASLAGWNPDAIVEFEASDSAIVAKGKGVVNLAPLYSRFSQSGRQVSIDVSYSSVPIFEIPKNSYNMRRLIARHSLLKGFSTSGEQTGTRSNSIQEMDISYSQFTTFDQILEFGSLRKLSIVGMSKSDASRLFRYEKSLSRLEELDIAGTPISSFAGLSSFKYLHTLRFSPELLGDKGSIEELRKMNLKNITTPNDSTGQPAMRFWEKWDLGEYSK